MQYIINYNTDGKILGFIHGKEGLNIEVSNTTYIEAMKYDKIIVDNSNINFKINGIIDRKFITFEKVDWRTPEEIEQETQSQFRANRDKLLVEADIEINKLVDLELDSTEWRVYRQELRDSTSTWVLPSKPEGAE